MTNGLRLPRIPLVLLLKVSHSVNPAVPDKLRQLRSFVPKLPAALTEFSENYIDKGYNSPRALDLSQSAGHAPRRRPVKGKGTFPSLPSLFEPNPSAVWQDLRVMTKELPSPVWSSLLTLRLGKDTFAD